MKRITQLRADLAQAQFNGDAAKVGEIYKAIQEQMKHLSSDRNKEPFPTESEWRETDSKTINPFSQE